MLKVKINRHEMIKIAGDFGNYLSRRNPFIKLLAISGSLTNSHIHKHEDIDFFIVSKKNKVWSCFAACIFYGFLYCKKLKKNRNFFCFNYLIDEKHIKGEIKINKSAAREILNLKILCGQQVYEDILIKNKKEIFDFYPRQYIKRLAEIENSLVGDEKVDNSGRGAFFIFIKPLFKLLAKLFEYKRKLKYKTNKIYSNSYIIRSHLHQ